MLDLLRELLAEGRTDEVMALVAKLVARNSELERRLADTLGRGRKNEGISTAQLLLMLEGLAAAFLFAGSDTGGERAAIAYTVLGSCELAKVNPVEYLADVLPRLARGVRLRDVPALLPARWNAARAADATLTAAAAVGAPATRGHRRRGGLPPGRTPWRIAVRRAFVRRLRGRGMLAP